MIRIGIDVGGTFTDIILERSGSGVRQIAVTKVPSTPRDQSEGVVDGILKVCSLAGVDKRARDPAAAPPVAGSTRCRRPSTAAKSHARVAATCAIPDSLAMLSGVNVPAAGGSDFPSR